MQKTIRGFKLESKRYKDLQKKIKNILISKVKFIDANTKYKLLEFAFSLSEEDYMTFYKNNIDTLSSINKAHIFSNLSLKLEEDELFDFFDELIDFGENGRVLDYIATLNQDTIKGLQEHLKYHVVYLDSMKNVDSLNLDDDNIKFVKMPGWKVYYSKDDFIKMHKEFLSFFIGIPHATNDPESQYEVFRKIYVRIFYGIKYDENAITKEGKKSNTVRINSRNMQNALLEKSCVCSGYATLLKQASEYFGIECSTIGGFLRNKNHNERIKNMFNIYPSKPNIAPESMTEFNDAKEKYDANLSISHYFGKRFYNLHSGGHAWNQVRIGDNWYNCDITNISPDKKILYSTKEFSYNKDYYYADLSTKDDIPHDCTVDFQDKKFNSKISLKAIKEYLKERLHISNNKE